MNSSAPTLFSFFTQAGPVVQLVMLGLLAMSVRSWSIIIQKWSQLKTLRLHTNRFLQQWQATENLESLHQMLQQRPQIGLAKQFLYGHAAWAQHRHAEAVNLSMSVAEQETISPLSRHLPTLATIGSVSPYIGLFGTVWGIMTSFVALGSAQQASIAMVAPGISEALIATAMGLFAAIPAVIAYNFGTQQINQFCDQSQLLQDQLKYRLTNNKHSKAAYAT